MRYNDEREMIRGDYEAMFPRKEIGVCDGGSGWRVCVREPGSTYSSSVDFSVDSAEARLQDDVLEVLSDYVNSESYHEYDGTYARNTIDPMYADDVCVLIERLKALIGEK